MLWAHIHHIQAHAERADSLGISTVAHIQGVLSDMKARGVTGCIVTGDPLSEMPGMTPGHQLCREGMEIFQCLNEVADPAGCCFAEHGMLILPKYPDAGMDARQLRWLEVQLAQMPSELPLLIFSDQELLLSMSCGEQALQMLQSFGRPVSIFCGRGNPEHPVQHQNLKQYATPGLWPQYDEAGQGPVCLSPAYRRISVGVAEAPVSGESGIQTGTVILPPIFEDMTESAEMLCGRLRRRGKQLLAHLEGYLSADPRWPEYSDLTAFSYRQEVLLATVQAYHEAENRPDLLGQIRSTVYIPDIFRALPEHVQHPVRGERIYFLNQREGLIYYVGDLHGDLRALKQVLVKTDFMDRRAKGESVYLVFLGDYVDRGIEQLEVLEALMLLKLTDPEYVILLRGNHDAGMILSDGTLELAYKMDPDIAPIRYFPKYITALSQRNPGFSSGLLQRYLEFFGVLGHCAFIRTGERYTMAVHGGLPRPLLHQQVVGEAWYAHLTCLYDFLDPDKRDHLGNPMRHNMVWSDPAPAGYEGPELLKEDKRRFRFSMAQWTSFRIRTGIDCMVRGHQAVAAGLRIDWDTVFTVFSSGIVDLDRSPGCTPYPHVRPVVLSWDSQGHRQAVPLAPAEVLQASPEFIEKARNNGKSTCPDLSGSGN